MTVKPKQPPPHVVELVDPSYHPTKADLENEWTVPAMTLDELARRVLEPVKLRAISRPPRNG